VYAIYSLLLFLALFFYLPIYAFRMKVLRKDRIYLRERLARGLLPRAPGRKAVWIHAVSVGEVLSLQNLVHELKVRHPEWDLCFSTLTNTGISVAREKLKDADAVFFVPLDFRSAVRRVLKAFRPDILVLAESEFWPNLLKEVKRQGKKILLINGRISEGSFKKYGDLGPLSRKIFRNVDLFLVQTGEDKEKLEQLGIEPGRLQVAGNLKSEVHLPDFTADELETFRRGLGMDGREKVVVAGSTRKGEEERLLKAFASAREKRDDLRFILAPRRVERAGEVEKAALALGFRTTRRTQVGPGCDWDVLILDTIGELARFYALSDASFVGGSLVDWGGHNILEPAYYGKPVFFGPHMQNFAFLAESFIRAGGARIVRTDEELVEMFLLRDESGLREMGSKAKAHLASLGGATDRTILEIERFMEIRLQDAGS
jgi:3-deoxy-D-manno-octulosonic-acid transferase